MAPSSNNNYNNASKNSTCSNIVNIVVVLFPVVVLMVSTFMSPSNSNNDGSALNRNMNGGHSLAHLMYPHPLNLTWHLNGPDCTHADGTHADGTHADGTHADGTHADSTTSRKEQWQQGDTNTDITDSTDSTDIDDIDDRGAPLIAIHDILPRQIVSRIVEELKSSTRVVQHPNGQLEHKCILRRDGLACGDERWIDFDAKSLLLNTQTTQATQPLATPRDIFEQAVIEIAKHDVKEVLKPHIAKHIIGVSWRLLVTKSGQISSIFHYDTDEDTEYVIPTIPLIYPLLSTVTYLTDAGEPTFILEHTQLISPTTTATTESLQNGEYKIFYPQNVYISMPKTNKHLAFDSRLFHGSAMPLSKQEGKYRLVIGMNFHTHQSFESKNNEDSETSLRWDRIIPPMQFDDNGDDEQEMKEQEVGKKHHDKTNTKPTIQPWNENSIIDRPSHDGWEQFDLFRHETHGYDFCLRPCFAKVSLPLKQILKYDEKYPGATLGFRLRKEDFHFTTTSNLDDIILPPQKQTSQDGIREATSIASEMLKKRCEIYKNDMFEMSPPLNQCSKE